MKILCVCTGNTCRSPMLAGLLASEMARRYPDRAIRVESAGTGAGMNMAASAEAVACLRGLGIDLSAHRSRPVDSLDLQTYDRILCMTSGHSAYMRSQGVPATKLEVVDAENGGVPDPYGGDRAAYAACLRVLSRYAKAFTLPDQPMTDPHAALSAARTALDKAHMADPTCIDDRPAELVYADHVERWLLALDSAPSDSLRLAARCQHLERWAIPRSDFSPDKAGYFSWRKAIQKRQGQRAGEMLAAAGCSPDISARVAQLVSKATPKGDRDGQILEDAACLVFLETELEPFASAHSDYTREKFIDIIRKTWRKMSPDGHRLALTIPLPAPLADLIKAAVAP